MPNPSQQSTLAAQGSQELLLFLGTDPEEEGVWVEVGRAWKGRNRLTAVSIQSPHWGAWSRERILSHFQLAIPYHTSENFISNISIIFLQAYNSLVSFPPFLQDLWKTVDDDGQWFYLVHGLPASWSAFRRIVESTNSKKDVQKLIPEMLGEELFHLPPKYIVSFIGLFHRHSE